MLLAIGFSFLAGIFTALSPCILPVLPAILAVGVAEGRLRPLGAIVGLAFSFSFFTLALTWVVHTTGISPSFLRYIAIALIFFFGLVLIFPQLSNWFAKLSAPIADLGQKIQGNKPRQGFWGGVVFGIALGLLWTPCAGPILGAITTLAATRMITLTVILMTLSYSIGTAIPMLLFAYGSAKLIRASRFLSRHAERVRQFFGFLMLLFAILLFFNAEMFINKSLARLFPGLFLEKYLPLENALEQVTEQENLSDKGPAPEIAGIKQWINSSPLTLAELRGKVVLIDFWTYSCINCIRTLPYLKNWYRDYKDYGFVIIGVHTPEFAFEKEYSNVKKAVAEFGIEYPVALDNDYQTWNAYHNRYWPAHYLIDQNGVIRMVHFGEGAYSETENAIRELVGMPAIAMPQEPQATQPTTPETYLGLARGNSYTSPLHPGDAVDYQMGKAGSDQVALKGPWSAEEEYIASQSDHSYLEFNFLATQVYLVLAGSSSIPLEIYLDGAYYGDILANGDKKYNIASASYQRHYLSLKVPKGIRAYAFTFGSNGKAF
ncbi:MAG TPA: cytochrome c biogenesis protein DipZ [Rhabdochlamydiaceae bacterium]|jgi:cytochrome c biogenesis protein CcdA/thiol-disulfide isomerase/thioredoxin